jgi:hypothetical protein
MVRKSDRPGPRGAAVPGEHYVPNDVAVGCDLIVVAGSLAGLSIRSVRVASCDRRTTASRFLTAGNSH